MEDFLDSLNPPQREAAETTDGAVLILAGAGSGKTRVITHRAAQLIKLGVSPFNILCITFTNKAAREMKERVEALTPSGSQIWVSTFHSLCVRILRREIAKIGYDKSFTIYDADDSERLMKRTLKELNVSDKLFPPRSVMSAVSALKDELVPPQVYEKRAALNAREGVVARVYALYQKRLQENNALDFDDLIFKTVELFLSRPDALNAHQERFRYIMVDEYQDTNTAQYTLVRLLSKKYGNLCVVGDDDQSIYAWRGANIRNILDFEKDYPDAKIVKLEQNYRSTRTILSAANAVISRNASRKDKRLWSEGGAGQPVVVWQGSNEREEAEYVADTIEKHRRQQDWRFADFAVLYRTNSQSRAIEDGFVRRGVPYRVYGGTRFYDRKEIRDVAAYLRAVYNPADSVSLRRIINTPRRGIGDASLERVEEYAAESGVPLIDALADAGRILGSPAKASKILAFVAMMDRLRDLSNELSVSDFIRHLLGMTGYAAELEAQNTDEARDRLDNIDEFIGKAVEFERSADTPLLSAFLEEVALVADIDAYEAGADAVSLMTLHSAKGLEFPAVFITGFEDGLFPSYRAQTSGDVKDLEEERRLCYVGITRAKSELYLTMAVERSRNGQTTYNLPSCFLKEIPSDFIKRVYGKKMSAPMTDDFDNEIEIPPAKHQIGEFRQKIAIGNKPAGFGGRSYIMQGTPAPADNLGFSVGDKVRALKYGVGEVAAIAPAGADYEVTVVFPAAGEKKFMAGLSKLKKVD
ncbi:MAG: UvrD-helicase domain-containing protein [Clostridiales bacterium]|nr:UvrD-helicase domain-containing protein [Clostridiales bacterium]